MGNCVASGPPQSIKEVCMGGGASAPRDKQRLGPGRKEGQIARIQEGATSGQACSPSSSRRRL